MSFAHPNPTVTVVIPVRNAPSYLRSCLQALRRSTLLDYEVIVVDDASTDQTAAVAAAEGAQVIRLPRQSGPGVARNQGAAVAAGRYILFLDSDVCVLPNTLGEIVRSFEADAKVDCVFGSYDTEPRAGNIVSQFRNLLHHFVHQEARTEAGTFWAGLGAIRREIFHQLGGFDPRYTRPQIEDIELGVRYVKAGRCIRLNKNAQATHLKRWTLFGMIRTDILDRGVPWTRLILARGGLPNDLNLKHSQRASVILAYALLGVVLWGGWHSPLILIIALCAGMFLLGIDRWSLTRRIPTALRVLAPVGTFVALVACGYFFSFIWTLTMLGGLAGIVALNYRLYSFFARERHPMFALLVLPLHVCYFLYSGFAFGVGIGLHTLGRLGMAHRLPHTGLAAPTEAVRQGPREPAVVR